MLLLISNIMFIEERSTYYPYIILSLIPMYAGFCSLIYVFINHFGAFSVVTCLYICFGAMAYGALMRRIHVEY
jgi:hypothetical protein